MILATVVETKELAQTVIASLVAGAGVTATFSVVIFGAARFADLRRDDRTAAAAAAAVLMAVGLLLTLAILAIGIVAMTQK